MCSDADESFAPERRQGIVCMSTMPICTSCGVEFASKNKLHAHIRLQHETPNITPIPTLSDSEELRIIHEDKYIIVVVKPQGMPTMGVKRDHIKCITNSDLMLLSDDEVSSSKYKKAVPVHRLDSATGGLVLCSKSLVIERRCREIFRNREVTKEYRAIVVGNVIPDEGIIDTPISDQDAKTTYRVLQRTASEKYGWITTLQLFPHTGRRHQLRRHCKDIGHPIIGDTRYSTMVTTESMFLWATKLTFPHPHYDTIVSVEIPEPLFYETYRCQQQANVVDN